jgi:uncharacterized protein (TIGR00369 family)
VTWSDPAAIAAEGRGLSGLAFLEAMCAGRLPPPPIAMLFGMHLREARPGEAVFECTPDESMFNPIGLIHGGLVCTLTDSAAGCAVQTTLDAGFGFTSIDITVNYLRPVTLDSGTLRAAGRVVKPGRRVAFAAAEVHDHSGRLVATATSNCLIFPHP